MAGIDPSRPEPAPPPSPSHPALDGFHARPRPQQSTTGFWVLLTLLVGAIGAVGTYVYLDRQEDGEPTAATVPTTPASAPTALVTAPPAAIVTFPPMAVGEPLPALPVLDASTQETFVFSYRRYDTAAPDSPYIEHLVQYGAANDTWVSVTNGTVQPRLTIAFFRKEHRVISYPDGTWERIPRTPASLAPEPDMWMAKRLSADDAIPAVARPFTTVVEIEPGTIQGNAVRTITMRVDVAAFAAAHPDVHTDWVFRWASPSPFDPALVDPTRRQVGSEPAVRGDPPVDTTGLPPDPTATEPTILLTVTADGGVERVVVIDPVNGFRSVYDYLGEIIGWTADEPDAPSEAGVVWVDASA